MRKRKLYLVAENEKPKDLTPPPANSVETPADPPLQLLGLPQLRRLPAGAVAPVGGIYRVYHKEHRLPHSMYVRAQQPLPACRHCGHAVEYGLLLSAAVPDDDPDFVDSLRKVG